MSSKLQDAKPETAELNRRDFLKRVGYASALALGTCGLGLALYDPKGPAPGEGRKPLTGLGDYARRPRPRGRRKWPSSGAWTGR